MTTSATIFLSLWAATPPAQPSSPAERIIEEIQASHIAGNVPPPATFGRFLRRDLQAYFAHRGIRKPVIRYALLRDAPTQSGIAYPKYYLWVWVWSGLTPAASGAVRVAAVDRKRFDITHFLSRTTILSDPDSVISVFPDALAEPIRQRAASMAFPAP